MLNFAYWNTFFDFVNDFVILAVSVNAISLLSCYWHRPYNSSSGIFWYTGNHATHCIASPVSVLTWRISKSVGHKLGQYMQSSLRMKRTSSMHERKERDRTWKEMYSGIFAWSVTWEMGKLKTLHRYNTCMRGKGRYHVPQGNVNILE